VTHPVSCRMGAGGAFLGVKRPGREDDHSPATNAIVKKMWMYTYIHSPIRFHGVVLNYLNTGTTSPLSFTLNETGM
jgi:hypothetical protein